jgi:nucleotide-binding universal stress UspA family protein
MFDTILVAIDGSEHAHKALEVASDLADKYDAKMILVHVLGEGKPPEALRRMVEAEHLVTPPRYTDLFKSFEYPEMAAMRSEVEREKYFH